MRKLHFITLAFTAVAFLAACSNNSTPAPIYDIVSAATLKAGEPIPAPTGPVILTVNGKISQKNVGDNLELDMATLEKMGLVKFDATDPFDKTKKVLTGVLVTQFLTMVGAAPEATSLHMIATDDYAADFNIVDTKKWPVLLATQADGNYLPLEKGGPTVLVFPFDDFPEIDHSVYDSQSVWSIETITVN